MRMFAIATFGGILFSGCASDGTQRKIMLSEDATAAEREILMHVPLGSSIAQARPIMEENGFACSGHRDQASPCTAT